MGGKSGRWRMGGVCAIVLTEGVKRGDRGDGAGMDGGDGDGDVGVGDDFDVDGWVLVRVTRHSHPL